MSLPPPDWILYHDSDLLVLNKPAGLPTLPDGYNPHTPHVRSVLEPTFGRVWIVHRLDRQTSGLLIVARTADAHRSLNTQFDQRQVAKRYHALVNGVPDFENRLVDLPLRPDGDRQHRTIIDSRRGKPASTGLKVLERFKGHALIEAAPHTGRTHQIRAHLAALGLPILADSLYGGAGLSAPSPSRRGESGEEYADLDGEHEAGDRLVIERPALHAQSIEFKHPTSGENIQFCAAYPEDFAVALRRLRRTGARNG